VLGFDEIAELPFLTLPAAAVNIITEKQYNNPGCF
jgi:hypothetical protein